MSVTFKSRTRKARSALIMAGGTGGHIFPALAVARALQAQGWKVTWLGGTGTADKPSMESRLVPPQGFAFEGIAFGGLRGKDAFTWIMLPFRLAKALWQSVQVIGRVRPTVVLGFGGYISFPAGAMAVLMGKPLVLHEQNSVAGLANRVLARVAKQIFTAFPNVLKHGKFVGNPLREEFLQCASPTERFAGREGALQLLVVGGSLGAQGLNRLVPKALALLPQLQRPHVIHQSGEQLLDDLRVQYLAAGVQAQCVGFIEDTASAYANADVVIARSGASTVTEIAAVGAAAFFVPFPFAVDDHQTSNAKYLVDKGAAWLEQQRDVTPQILADFLQNLTRDELLVKALAAKQMAKSDAVNIIVAACEGIAT